MFIKKSEEAEERKTKMTPEVISHFIRELQHPYKTLTAWELGFLASISDQFERNSKLTEKQFEILERIYTEKTA